MPRSSTPALVRCTRCFCISLLPSAQGDGVGFRATSPISGLIHAACSLAVYTSRNGSPRSRATLASSRAPPFAGQGLDLSALAERFPTPNSSHRLSPFRSSCFCLAYHPFRVRFLDGNGIRGCEPLTG